MKRPFQFDSGIATQIRTLSPAGGCVVTAVTRQRAGLFGSAAADSIVVFGSAISARLSQVRTGLAFGISALGGGPAGGPPRPGPATGAPGGTAPRPPPPW